MLKYRTQLRRRSKRIWFSNQSERFGLLSPRNGEFLANPLSGLDSPATWNSRNMCTAIRNMLSRVWISFRTFGLSTTSIGMRQTPERRRWLRPDWTENELECLVLVRHIDPVRSGCLWWRFQRLWDHVCILLGPTWLTERQFWILSHTFRDTIIRKKVTNILHYLKISLNFNIFW